MLKFTKGDLLNSDAEALVNTVNTVGVMGKGIALQFKNRYPNNFKVYKEACKAGTFKTGQVLVVKDGDLIDQKIIINFPTKKHWKEYSKYEYITEGLIALKSAIKEYNIKSIAIPPLGCGNGGLDWSRVKMIIERQLQSIDIPIYVFTPNPEIKNLLQNKRPKGDVKLTPARAMLLYLMFHYETKGEQSSLFAVNKLAYFLQRSGEKMRLKFEPHHYGPYSVQVNHVLLHLNGYYLKGIEQNVAKPFESLQLDYSKYHEIEDYVNNKLDVEQRQRLKKVIKLLQGFESTFALELLSSVDYVSSTEPGADIKAIQKGVSKWSIRKSNLFKEQYIQTAYNHLKNYATSM